VISHFLKEHYSKTLFFLTGIMVGALRLPLEKVINDPKIPSDFTVLTGAILSGLIGIYSLLSQQALPASRR